MSDKNTVFFNIRTTPTAPTPLPAAFVRGRCRETPWRQCLRAPSVSAFAIDFNTDGAVARGLGDPRPLYPFAGLRDNEEVLVARVFSVGTEPRQSLVEPDTHAVVAVVHAAASCQCSYNRSGKPPTCCQYGKMKPKFLGNTIFFFLNNPMPKPLPAYHTHFPIPVPATA